MSSRRPIASPLPADQFAGLAELLWRERELLEELQYRLTVQGLLVEAGSSQWAARADDDVRRVIGAVRECEVLRMVEADALGSAAGLGPDATLRSIADTAPEPWSTILHDHHGAMAALVDAVDELMMSTRTKLPDVDAHRYRSSREDAADAG